MDNVTQKPKLERQLHAAIADTLIGGENVLPDYDGKGLFNLAVTLARVCGAQVEPSYADLQLRNGVSATKSWSSAQTLIFLLIDGLGDDLLKQHADIAPTLLRHRDRAITSVFPSTTATAITTLMTAEPAAAHGLLGWFVRDAHSGEIVAPLPMRHRAGVGVSDPHLIGRMLATRPMLARAQRRTRFVTLPELAAGPYARHHGASAKVHVYDELGGLADAVCRSVQDASEAQFVYAYTPLLDGTAHEFGISSPEVRAVLMRMEAVFVDLCARLPDALIVVTADHGFIDCPESHCVDFGAHPELYAMLRGPLSGERRAAYCDVKPEFADVFGARVEAELGHALCAVRAQDAHASGLFGPTSAYAASRAKASAGDWILIARDNWTVSDLLPGEKPHRMIGVHGGMSHQEMWVPLIVRPPA